MSVLFSLLQTMQTRTYTQYTLPAEFAALRAVNTVFQSSRLHRVHHVHFPVHTLVAFINGDQLLHSNVTHQHARAQAFVHIAQAHSPASPYKVVSLELEKKFLPPAHD